MSAVMMFGELKFTLGKWRKGEFDVGQNDVKWGYYCTSEYRKYKTQPN